MKAEELAEKLMNNTGKTVKVVYHPEDGIPYTIDIDEVKYGVFKQKFYDARTK